MFHQEKELKNEFTLIKDFDRYYEYKIFYPFNNLKIIIEKIN